MFAHILDHCIFSARWKDRTKRVAFGVVAFLIVANFWWFRGVAWGIEGPINDHRGLLWRKVRVFRSWFAPGADGLWDRHGTFIMHEGIPHQLDWTDRTVCSGSICSFGFAMSHWLDYTIEFLS